MEGFALNITTVHCDWSLGRTKLVKWMNELFFTVVVLNLNKCLTIDFNQPKTSTSAQQMLCIDYSNIQEGRNISNLYKWLLEGVDFLSMVFEMNVLSSFLQKRDVPTEMSLGSNKVSGCYTKPTLTFFLQTW